jgi:hypothetical protein
LAIADCPADRSVVMDFAHVVPLQGVAVTVHGPACLAIDDAVGCHARILAGRAWITAEGAPRDVIAEAGTVFLLEPGVRFNLGAFHDTAVVLITPPLHRVDVGFSLQTRGDVRVLTVTADRHRFTALTTKVYATIATFARHWLATTRTATN